MVMKEILFYQHTNNKAPVVEWLKTLDKPFRIRIQDRLTRIEQDDNYGDFKNCVAEAVIEHLKPLQAMYFDLMKNQDYLCAVLEEGKRVAQERASRMMSKVYKKIGMI